MEMIEKSEQGIRTMEVSRTEGRKFSERGSMEGDKDHGVCPGAEDPVWQGVAAAIPCFFYKYP